MQASGLGQRCYRGLKRTVIAGFALWAGVSCLATAQTNSWLGGNGVWQTQGQWSLNQLPAGGQDIVITNGGTFAVTINSQTASNFSLAMTVSSLSLSNATGSSTLLLTNSPTSTTTVMFTISNNVVVGAGSVLNAADSGSGGAGVTVQAPSLVADGTVFLHDNTTLSLSAGVGPLSYGLHVASAINATGVVSIVGGSLVLNADIAVGDRGNGLLLVSNGFLQAGEVDLGVTSGAFGSWRIEGGSNTVNGLVVVGFTTGATGEVVVTGGELATAADLQLGGYYVNQGGVGRLVISNGIVNPRDLLVGYSLGGMGTVTVAGGVLNVGLYMRVGDRGTGTVWLIGGEIDVTNSTPGFGKIVAGDGFLTGPYHNQLICSGGVLRASEVDAGRGYYPTSSVPAAWIIAGGTSIVGRVLLLGSGEQVDSLAVSGGRLQASSLTVSNTQMTVSGGNVQVDSFTSFEITSDRQGTGTVVVAGGNLNCASGQALIGSQAKGRMLVSSGTFSAPSVYVGESPGSLGLLTITGGVVNVTVSGPSAMDLGVFPGSTGIVQCTGGTLNALDITVGDRGFGSLAVSSNADLPQFASYVVGKQNGGVGEMSIRGGTLFGSPTRQVGYLRIGVSAASTGTLWVTDGALQTSGNCSFPSVGEQGSGRLSATNSALHFVSLSIGSQGTFECVNSQFNVDGFCSVINSNVMLFVNSTGTFPGPLQNAGSILANGSTLTFYGMVNNTGVIVLTNGWAQFSGGINNTGVVLFGPDKFRIMSVSTTGNDVAIGWQAFTGNRYRVQAANSLTDNFVDVSSDILASGSGLGTTNYVDSGGLTNFANRFYRVRHIY